MTSWATETRRLRARLEAYRSPSGRPPYDPREVDRLPLPVRRYLHQALVPGQPIITAVTMTHEGTFNTNPNGESWRRFSSTQRVVTRRPGFDWDARIAMLPGVTVRVHDAYVNGEGMLHAALFGMFDVEKSHDTTGLALGELMRFLAEAAWYPTALLPREGVHWLAVDDSSARARLTDGTPLVILAGKDYGMGSSRDWAAKGAQLQGAKAVIAESIERIHRSNLVMMGVLPLTFEDGQNWQTLGLTGHEYFDIPVTDDVQPGDKLTVTATGAEGNVKQFSVLVRLDTPVEVEYYKNGGILQTVLRNFLKG